MQPTTSKAVLTTISMVYFSVLFAMVMFSVVVLYLKNTGGLPPSDAGSADVFKYPLYVLAPGGVAAGFFIYKQMISKIDLRTSLRTKIGGFQAAMLVRAACLEIPGLFGAVCAFLTGDMSFLIFTGIMAILFVYFRPTAESIANDLLLSDMERSILLSPEGVIE